MNTLDKISKPMNWLLNQWWFSWLNRWWLQALVQAVGVTWLLSWVFPNSGLSELSNRLVSILGYVAILTGIVLGALWFWRRRLPESR
jgi:hypothetical protein